VPNALRSASTICGGVAVAGSAAAAGTAFVARASNSSDRQIAKGRNLVRVFMDVDLSG
jgi:hypothetical protein